MGHGFCPIHAFVAHCLQVILQHFYLRQPEVLAQCEQWKNAVRTSGFELTSSLDTLRTELSKLVMS